VRREHKDLILPNKKRDAPLSIERGASGIPVIMNLNGSRLQGRTIT